ncbi:asparaginase [Sulfobacillus thermosulfidooxidans DSM 9293]|uniref:Asparaginase n=1 Tax=Sulfobacillus thermosulfidooxidans (strain DSM 9293 / VKM B-1269 / AT-1) TaxID=929705 RepID=A0A1W1WI47_SULTA|nr:asparaginase [Sulfobacillus thermosulfidooxidans]SMC05423.1 asparaginase [Sulfobacillus thermosulfidooxidans DSM 9293]
MAEKAVEILRGKMVESRAFADVAVVDSLGHIRFWLGDPERPTFWRSSAKPFQALPVILSGAMDRYHFSSEDVAIICASHGGEEAHVQQVSSLLERIGASSEDLACGVHPPSDQRSWRTLLETGQEPTILHNNCSGKHTGMLTLARMLDAPLAGYEQSDHPVQRKIRQAVSLMTDIPETDLITGIDGCSVPTFYLPLARMALAYARLVDPRGLPEEIQAATAVISEAMRLHPYLVSGTGRLEVTLAEATHHRFVAKGGAEAVFCLGIPEKGLGLAVKIDDGMSRTIPPVVIHALEDMGILSAQELMALSEVKIPILRNHRGLEVGRITPTFHLHRGKILCGH